ncbi:hypothetical protein Tco_0600228 [Tanacetum coccineum]|uniref:Uncharacterized protein n=1 Tax=Tanacetum coccineum TaxID=301880 RepID=A0ABQ4WB84_9ASTR
MLVQPTQKEGTSSERLSEAHPTPSPEPTSEAPNESLNDSSSAQSSEVPFEQQPRPSPNPSPTPNIPDSIPEHTGENLGDHSFNDTSLSGNEDAMTLQNVYDLCISLCKQVSDQAKEIKLLKAKITKLKRKANPVIKHFKAYQKRISKAQRHQRKHLSKKKKVQIESVSKQGRKNAKGDGKAKENAQSEGRTKEMMDEDKETDEVGLSTEDEVSTAKKGVSTELQKFSTDRQKLSYWTTLKVSTDEQMESTEEQSKEEIASQASQTSSLTPTSVIFGDDETIATLLINMRPRTTSTRSTLTLKPLPKIDPKDKGKKKIEEEDETESEDDDIPQVVKKFKQLENDEELARKRFNEHVFPLDTKEEVKDEDKDEESTRKRKLGTRKKMKSRKRRYIQHTSEDDSDKENDDLRLYLTIAQDEDKEVDYEILDKKYPIIDWKTECFGTKPQPDEAKSIEEINLNVVTRSNGQQRHFSVLTSVLSIFDREDLNAVYQLVMNKYQDEMPEGFERVLWGDLMVLFNLIEQDELVWSTA